MHQDILKKNPYIKGNVKGAVENVEKEIKTVPFKKIKEPELFEVGTIEIEKYVTDENQESFLFSIEKEELESFKLKLEDVQGIVVSKITKKIGFQFNFRDKVAREEKTIILIDKNIQLSDLVEKICQVELKTLFLLLSNKGNYLLDKNGDLYSVHILDRQIYQY